MHKNTQHRKLSLQTLSRGCSPSRALPGRFLCHIYSYLDIIPPTTQHTHTPVDTPVHNISLIVNFTLTKSNCKHMAFTRLDTNTFTHQWDISQPPSQCSMVKPWYQTYNTDATTAPSSISPGAKPPQPIDQLCYTSDQIVPRWHLI